MGVYIGIDLGGTHIKVTAVDREGTVRARVQVETRDFIADAGEKTQYWLGAIERAVEEVREESGRDLDGMGVAAPGLVSRDERVIQAMPGRLQGLEGLDWTRALGGTEMIPVMNDAQAALLAENWIGAAAGARDAFLLTLGTGVGGAVLSEGRILRGRLGRAGHLGHLSLDLDGRPDICGTPGSLEWLVGQETLPERSSRRFQTYEQLLEAYRGGDVVATEVWLRSVKSLAAGIASLINVLDPEVVLLGGGISAAEEIDAPLSEFLDAFEWRPTGHTVPVRSAELGTYGGAIGAARRAMTSKHE